MKIYEKPMAAFEMMDVEDVIAASVVDANGDELNALKSAAGTDNVIIFQW